VRAIDAVVDLRPDSPTYRNLGLFELSGQTQVTLARALRTRDPSFASARSRPHVAVDNSDALGQGGLDA
jgi:hypothetical protein